ncbi:tetratricopeptide repeat protein [Chloroflexus sp. MS-CIW-1]|uniref:tetratricopeptide repeat protein n=1 Tax=Chloroflexus sp. MS-CIW-1 TaxID=3055768 RepID=UPI0026492617|nr:tetratricopeptide repeat protein [Chloroflexus sp. MS-CIW-1]MDN5272660.1 tetratricopeptide repeat protein [Chloroflexus sp. MS-CIW-1]
MATISLQDAYTQARTFLEANQIEQAIGLIQHIIEYHPDNLEAQRLLGEAYLAQRDLPAAVATFEQVLQADPENIPAHVGLGMAYEWQGRLDKAIAEFEQALEIRPDMPELRAQLVRLYTEAWGSEHAALRLSRSGLARLYARGQMLPQAILEFRNVVDEHPNRLDAWVGLIEALWRNDQLDEAVAVCQQVLKQHPLLLKANLILGAILLNNGDQRGIEYWRIAQRLDPYQTVARMLFDPLPSGIPIPDVSLPEWNEAEWQARRSAAAAPVSATAPAPDDFFAEASWLTPTVQSAPVAASAASDDDLLAMLLFSPTVATSVAEPPPSAVADHDTFLDSLLSSTSTLTGLTLDEIGVDVSRAPVTPSEPTLQPFSLEDLGLSAEEIAQLEGKAPAAEPELKPFSLEELGLSAEEIAQLEGKAPAAEPELKPFSLEELGLSAEEIAQLEGKAPAAEPELKPFSLEDLGLSSEEIAQLEGQAPAAEPELKPFSLEELGLSAEEIAQLEGQAPAAEPELKPFSLEELGLSSEEIAQLRGASALSTPTSGTETFDDDLSGLQPFSLDDLEFGSATTGSDLPSTLQPFSLDDLALDEEMTAPPESSTETIEPGIYSWQEPSSRSSGIQIPQESEPTGPSIFSKLLERASHLPPFEEPPLSSVELTEADVAAYFSSDDVSLREEDDSEERLTGTFRIPKTSLDESLAPTGAVSALSEKKEDVPAEPELTPFSLEELGLSPEEIAQLEAAQQQAQPAPAEPELTPFSLEELGLSPEEIAQLEAAQQQAQPAPAEPELKPFSLEELGLSPEEIAQLEAAQQQAQPAPAEPELTPFSLEELGLSPEEIAQLEAAQQQAQPAPAEPELKPFSLEELGLSPEEIAQLEAAQQQAQPAPAEPELTPFSLEELGLSPEEIAQLEAAQQPQATGETVAFTDESIDNLIATASSDESDIFAHLEPAATTDETSFEIPGVEPISFEEFASLEPFSFDDIEGGTTTTSELGISPEEIEGIELGNFETVVLSDNEEPMIDTGDPDLNRLIQLGYRQGYVDLTDIIAVVKDPEREADRIEQIGWSLYRAGIQIRDGDEIIDMEAELGEEEPAGVSPTVSADLTPFDESPANPAEPELTPFSLEELGLSPEEIAQLEAAQQQAQPAPAEPELTPFSLEELGLSPEEIAQLEAAQQQAQPAPAEPELTPFSLEELGLSPEEIAQLEAAQQQAPPADAEPELKPFSLEELGLSPEEIAQLEAAQQQAQPADAEPELKPFSLEELGLSPEEIAQLEAARQTQPQPETAVTSEDDLFDFSVAETAPVAKAVRTAPRREEPPRTPAPEDIGFVPEPLDALDDIWQTPPELPKAEPARVVLPPLGERAKSQPTSRPSVSEERRNVTPTRDDLRFARREAASSGRGRSARAPLRPRAPEDFIPTGNTTIDDYLRQLSSNPTNHALAFTIARLCAQTGQAELMAVIYRRLLKHSNLLAQMAEELEDLINTVEERPVLRQLYRILGDVYSRQGRLEEAIATYSATFAE